MVHKGSAWDLHTTAGYGTRRQPAQFPGLTHSGFTLAVSIISLFQIKLIRTCSFIFWTWFWFLTLLRYINEKLLKSTFPDPIFLIIIKNETSSIFNYYFAHLYTSHFIFLYFMLYSVMSCFSSLRAAKIYRDGLQWTGEAGWPSLQSPSSRPTN